MKVLDQQPGMFGQLSVVETSGARRLYIDQQNQGGLVLGPDGQPLPIAMSGYTTGWLLAGSQNPTGEALMVGLGSGAGPVSLLTCFPGLDLTVIEIDPAVVEMAQKWFPDVAHLMDHGRLRVLTGDAVGVLQQSFESGDRWDFAMADAYQGSERHHCPDDLLAALLSVTPHLWFNCIDHQGGPDISLLSDHLAALGAPIQHVLDCAPKVGQQLKHNLICTTQAIDPQKADAFEPYQGTSGWAVEHAREQYVDLLGGEIVTNQVDSL